VTARCFLVTRAAALATACSSLPRRQPLRCAPRLQLPRRGRGRERLANAGRTPAGPTMRMRQGLARRPASTVTVIRNEAWHLRLATDWHIHWHTHGNNTGARHPSGAEMGGRKVEERSGAVRRPMPARLPISAVRARSSPRRRADEAVGDGRQTMRPSWHVTPVNAQHRGGAAQEGLASTSTAGQVARARPRGLVLRHAAGRTGDGAVAPGLAAPVDFRSVSGLARTRQTGSPEVRGKSLQALQPPELNWRRTAASSPHEAQTSGPAPVVANPPASEITRSRSEPPATLARLEPGAVDRLAEDVLRRVERQLRIERERRGL